MASVLIVAMIKMFLFGAASANSLFQFWQYQKMAELTHLFE
jgi:hypothetical protein